MPYGEPDAVDPMTLHGVQVETDDDGAASEMAVCFIEEYARMGFSPERILEIFLRPDFAGPRLAVSQLGPEVIASLIDRHFLSRGSRRSRIDVEQVPQAGIRLPVLE